MFVTDLVDFQLLFFHAILYGHCTGLLLLRAVVGNVWNSSDNQVKIEKCRHLAVLVNFVCTRWQHRGVAARQTSPGVYWVHTECA